MVKQLWPHQQRAIAELRRQASLGNKWNAVVIPTGGGKAFLAAEFARLHLEKNPLGRVLLVVHRDTLVEQLFDTCVDHGLQVGAIQASGTRAFNPWRPVQVASIQTLLARNEFPDGISLFIFDEVHHAVSTEWSRIPMHYKMLGVPGIGLTATPARGDKVGHEELWDTMTIGATVKELIAAGTLVPFEVARPKHKLQPNQVAQHPLEAYIEHGEGRKCVVFAANVKSAEEYLDDFIKGGIPTGLVHSKLPTAARRKAMEDYKSDKVRVLINVNVLTEGFDDRPTSAVIIARNIGSLSLWLQICGRALRASPETGKKDALIIDLFGAFHDHGSPDVEHQWSLEGETGIRKKLETSPERFCRVCQAYMEDDMDACPDCGLARPQPQVPVVVGVKLERYATKRKESDGQRAQTLARWTLMQIAKGYKEGWVFAKYKAVYNEPPSLEVRREAKEILKKRSAAELPQTP